jgi:hypothetical protein
MTRRRRLLLLGLTTLTVLALCACLLRPRTAITRENAERIRAGMTIAEVEALLGGPPRDDSTGPVVAEVDPEHGILEEKRLTFYTARWTPERPNVIVQWQSDEVNISVAFTAEGRVDGSGYLRLHRVQESPLDRLSRWLHFRLRL